MRQRPYVHTVYHSAMDQSQDELKRALRTAMPSLEATKLTVSPGDANRHIADAVHQLAFVLERLVDGQAKPI